MKELIGRLFQVDVLKGMGVTFRTQHPGNGYTEQYPQEWPMVADRHRLEEGQTPTRYTR